MKKTHHPGCWTLSISGVDLSLSLSHAHTHTHTHTHTHSHTHTHTPRYVVLSIWGMFLSTRKSSPGWHVTLWSVTQASSRSLTPSYLLIITHMTRSLHHDGRVCVCVRVCVWRTVLNTCLCHRRTERLLYSGWHQLCSRLLTEWWWRGNWYTRTTRRKLLQGLLPDVSAVKEGTSFSCSVTHLTVTVKSNVLPCLSTDLLFYVLWQIFLSYVSLRSNHQTWFTLLFIMSAPMKSKGFASVKKKGRKKERKKERKKASRGF